MFNTNIKTTKPNLYLSNINFNIYPYFSNRNVQLFNTTYINNILYFTISNYFKPIIFNKIGYNVRLKPMYIGVKNLNKHKMIIIKNNNEINFNVQLFFKKLPPNYMAYSKINTLSIIINEDIIHSIFLPVIISHEIGHLMLFKHVEDYCPNYKYTEIVPIMTKNLNTSVNVNQYKWLKGCNL